MNLTYSEYPEALTPGSRLLTFGGCAPIREGDVLTEGTRLCLKLEGKLTCSRPRIVL